MTKIKLKAISGQEHISDDCFELETGIMFRGKRNIPESGLILNFNQRWSFKSFKQTKRSLYIKCVVYENYRKNIQTIELRSTSCNIPELIYEGQEKEQVYFGIKHDLSLPELANKVQNNIAKLSKTGKMQLFIKWRTFERSKHANDLIKDLDLIYLMCFQSNRKQRLSVNESLNDAKKHIENLF